MCFVRRLSAYVNFLFCLLILSSCATVEPPKPVLVVPIDDAPRGLSIINESTKKYATYGAKTEACSYSEYYVGTSQDGIIQALFEFGYVVWTVAGKSCSKTIAELNALAPQCARRTFGSASPPIRYRLYRTIAGKGDEASKFLEQFTPDRLGNRVIFRNNQDCNVGFLDN
jgi:hypothetical protein